MAAGLAEFSTQEIIEIMALGWIVTVLIELVAWRLSLRRPVVEQEPEAIPVPAPVPVAAAAPPEPDAAPEPEPEPPSEEEVAARAEEDAGGLRMTEPKRGGLFGWKRKESPGEITDETSEPPRHVRLIERPSGEDEEHEPAGDHDAPPAERKGA